MRFIRQVQSTRSLEGLISERDFARKINKTTQWVKNQEKHGRLQPSWFHRRSNGQIEFYFTEQDIGNALSSLI